ncbi:hypothetical protein OPQ81_000629 [Rhizoctonia solani]|nr:hypothetical protein OPQ81_000629 [Rhizoctonia solani]
MKEHVITVGIGGATCSGKTTLSSQLCAMLPNCTVIHQDSYWADTKDCPMHPVHHEPDLEDPRSAIKWPAFRADVKALKAMANSKKVGEADGWQSSVPLRSTDNTLADMSKLSDEIITEWTQRFRELDKDYRARGVLLKWFIVEGWHLFYDVERIYYNNEGRKKKYISPEGIIWVDPPYYWKDFTYPAYLRTHSRLFQGGEVETNLLSSEAEYENITLLDGEGTQRNLSWEDIFQHAASEILFKGTEGALLKI